jgi:hypothetical protein
MELDSEKVSFSSSSVSSVAVPVVSVVVSVVPVVVMVKVVDEVAPGLPVGRGLHSSPFQLNLSGG